MKLHTKIMSSAFAVHLHDPKRKMYHTIERVINGKTGKHPGTQNKHRKTPQLEVKGDESRSGNKENACEERRFITNGHEVSLCIRGCFNVEMGGGASAACVTCASQRVSY